MQRLMENYWWATLAHYWDNGRWRPRRAIGHDYIEQRASSCADITCLASFVSASNGLISIEECPSSLTEWQWNALPVTARVAYAMSARPAGKALWNNRPYSFAIVGIRWYRQIFNSPSKGWAAVYHSARMLSSFNVKKCRLPARHWAFCHEVICRRLITDARNDGKISRQHLLRRLCMLNRRWSITNSNGRNYQPKRWSMTPWWGQGHWRSIAEYWWKLRVVASARRLPSIRYAVSFDADELENKGLWCSLFQGDWYSSCL